ncbi:DUF4364 family protein [Neobittarella massiliensis]|uniref:DUF4364 family protein n=2 Tax=Oscillospiraceae TaxID=216572 RepID=A0A8J6IPN5_9FIRM|nr:DUF4364 family protein [Neobittarella massiliensis]MBC3515946.1 DUF4364 family protein [Neobittarella massiliensis]SCJ41796.1 Uncharacterised protein [uncultured Anaerotruncus sp.]
MENSAFIHGTEPGGLTTTTEIKVLLCHLCGQHPTGVPQKLLVDSLTVEGIANYFELTSAIGALIDGGQLRVQGDLLLLGQGARDSAELLAAQVPLSVREKAEELLGRQMELLRRQSETDVRILKVSDGYVVRCSVLDIGTDLFAVSIFAPTKAQAQRIRDNFLQDPQRLYQYNLFLLTGDDFAD